MRRRATLVFVLAAVGALIVSACGGANPTATAVPPTAMPVQPTATPVQPTATKVQATAMPVQPTATTAAPTATPRPGETPPPTATATSVPATATPRPTATPVPTQVPPTATPSGPQPKYGSTLNATVLLNPANWDAWDAKGQLIAIVVFMNTFSNVIVQDADKPALLKPDLAERWEVAGDGSNVTFHLRRGVKWHNGRDLTASDIAWNFQRGVDAEGTTVYLKSRFTNVASIETPDDYTVQVNLKQPSASFLPNMGLIFVLMYPPFGPPPGSPEFKMVESAVGTGPFKLDSFKDNERFDFVRNDDYYKEDARGNPLPYLDGVTLFPMRGAIALAAWRTKKIDCGCVWDFLYLTPLEDNLKRDFPGARLIGGNTSQFHLYFNQKEPWLDKRVRQAVFQAVDRKLFRDVYGEGKAHYPPGIMLSDQLGGAWAIPDSELLKRPGFRLKGEDKDPADVEAALAALRALNIDPKDLTIIFNHSGSTQKQGETVKGSIEQALGLTVDLRIFQSSGEVREAMVRGDFDLGYLQGGNGFDDPSDQPTRYLLSNSPENFGKWDFTETDKVYQQIEGELDPAKRKELSFQWQRMILDEAIATPLGYGYFVNGAHAHVMGWVRGHYSTNSGQRYETMWIDEDLR